MLEKKSHHSSSPPAPAAQKMGKEKEGDSKRNSNDNNNKKKKGWWMASIFMHADAVDKFLMTLGFIGAVGDGFTTPLVLVVSSHLMNNIGHTSSSSITDSFVANIDKVDH